MVAGRRSIAGKLIILRCLKVGRGPVIERLTIIMEEKIKDMINRIETIREEISELQDRIEDQKDGYEEDSEEYAELEEQFENLDDASDCLFDAVSALEEITIGNDGGIKITIQLG